MCVRFLLAFVLGGVFVTFLTSAVGMVLVVETSGDSDISGIMGVVVL